MCVDPVLRRKKSSMFGLWILLTHHSVLLESTFTLYSGLFLRIRPSWVSTKWVSSKEIVKHCLKAIDDMHSYTHVYNHVPLCTSSFPFVLSDRSDDIITSK